MCFSASECTDPTKRPKLKIVYINTTDVNEISQSDITISPNPVANEFKIDGLNDGTVFSIQIYSMIGQLIYQNNQPIASEPIDMSTFDNGIYLLNITQGPQKITKKIVVQR